jgi:hypothetical protein
VHGLVGWRSGKQEVLAQVLVVLKGPAFGELWRAVRPQGFEREADPNAVLVLKLFNDKLVLKLVSHVKTLDYT